MIQIHNSIKRIRKTANPTINNWIVVVVVVVGIAIAMQKDVDASAASHDMKTLHSSIAIVCQSLHIVPSWMWMCAIRLMLLLLGIVIGGWMRSMGQPIQARMMMIA
jgi:TctA family transporter